MNINVMMLNKQGSTRILSTKGFITSILKQRWCINVGAFKRA